MKDQILIVDDEPKFVIEFVEFLNTNGYKDLLTAGHGQDGLKKAKQHKPGLIITEVMMPVMDGFALFKELRKNALTKTIPVVVLTDRFKMKETFEAFGVDQFILKPYVPEELLKIIAKYVEKTLELKVTPKVFEKSSAMSGAAMTNVFQGELVTSLNNSTSQEAETKLTAYESKSMKRTALIFGKNAGAMSSMAGLLKQEQCPSRIVKDENQLFVELESSFPNLIMLQINADTTLSMSEIVEKLLATIEKKMSLLGTASLQTLSRLGNIVLYRVDGSRGEDNIHHVDHWIAAGCKKYIGTYKAELFLSRISTVLV